MDPARQIIFDRNQREFFTKFIFREGLDPEEQGFTEGYLQGVRRYKCT